MSVSGDVGSTLFAEGDLKTSQIVMDELRAQGISQVPGDLVFKMYDTYGFPFDLTADIARERELSVDSQGFDEAMEAQRERARAASQFGADQSFKMTLEGETCFTGYDHLEDEGSVQAIYVEGEAVDAIEPGQQAIVILDRTPFYAESGGQVGDRGLLVSHGGGVFAVRDTRKQGGDVFGHVGALESGKLAVGDSVDARVNKALRQATVLNHSATHLMHAALRHVLGDHVQQKGSLVDAERLRFDFSHFEPVSKEQLLEIEQLVNNQIRANNPAETKVMPLEQAKASGAMALFGEKYADDVRVLRAAVMYQRQGLGKALRVHRLQQVIDSLRLEGFQGMLPVGRGKHDGRRLIHRGHVERCFHTIHSRHANIQQYDIGVISIHPLQRLKPIGRFATNLIVRQIRQQLP